MKFYTISTPVKFEMNGEEKTKWLPVGSLNQTDDGKMFIQLNQNPTVKYMVFEQKLEKKKPTKRK